MGKQDFRIETRVVLFTDIHDFSIAMGMLAGELYDFLQETYQKLGDIVVACQGEIVKYLGDAMLCVFPAGSETDVVRCSMELRKAFAGIVRDRGLPADTELEIGICSGEVVIGVFGHKSFMQKDVFGETVNRAAKIGHHRGIAVTEAVHDKIKQDFKLRELPEFRVKWQDEPLRVWEVVE